METVLITGGKGLIGQHLTRKLIKRGYKVVLLSRKVSDDRNVRTYRWDPEKNEIDREAIEQADYIIHLAGAGIGDKRWTKKRKQLILSSRVISSELIFEKVKETHKNLKAYITASGIGYYGSITSEKVFREEDPPYSDFMGEVCRRWENAADRFEGSGIRTVKLRTGIVLAEEGGAMKRMMTPVKIGIGSALGTGKQYLPWIHIEDLCNIYIKAIEDQTFRGVFNSVAPEQTTNREFMATLARVLGKPFFFPDIPDFMLKILFGEMASILLNGSRISSEKIISSGYSFLFPDLESALRDLFHKQ